MQWDALLHPALEACKGEVQPCSSHKDSAAEQESAKSVV